jgi:hypothetical protein
MFGAKLTKMIFEVRSINFQNFAKKSAINLSLNLIESVTVNESFLHVGM